MATINKKKICGKHGFYNAEENKSCPKCKKYNNETYDRTLRAKDRKKIYNSKNWKEIRLKAMLRDEFMCVMCKAEGKQTKAEEVDHIVELSDDIDKAFDINNLQSLCRPHHAKKSEEERKKRRNKC